MATEEVKLPELGESITEGIITAWLVEVGDQVEQDQPLFELSTDKVDTEVPSPVAGVLKEQKAAIDDTVEVGEVIAVIDTDASGSGDTDASGSDDSETSEGDDSDADEADSDAEQAEEAATEADAPEETAQAAQQDADDADRGSEPEPEERSAPATTTPAGGGSGGRDGQAQVEGASALVSPLVRKLLREAGISPDQVEGTGQGGRITREDAEHAIEQGPSGTRATTPATSGGGQTAPAPARERERPEPGIKQLDFGGDRQQTEELSRVRKAIARHMHDSLRSTAQLTAVVEVDLTRLMTLRAHHKDAFKQREGVSLSPLPLIARAVCMTIPRHPIVNSRIDVEEGKATFFNFVNLGIAVDTERGLLVPNLKDAQDMTVPALARNIGDLAERARSKKLQPDEISGGTFTITNTGSRGAMLDTPILNPPEVAILATTLVEKRPVVVTDEFGQDAIAIRWMSYFCLTYDHRMVDGADAARFLADLKYVLEAHDFGPELGS